MTRVFRRASVAIAAYATCLAACSKSEPATSSPTSVERAPIPAASTEPPAAADAVPKIEDTSFRFPAVPRIVAIGDLHGDVSAARAALRLAGAIDDADKWVGGGLVVVQTGDQLDRGDDEPDILDLFDRLRAQAKAAGGALYALNGNHEVMNVQGDFRYVTEDGFHDFRRVKGAGSVVPLLERLPAEQRGRAAAFLPGGDVAKRLSVQPVVVQVGDNVFVHGGVLESHLRYGIGKLNREVQDWMRGPPSDPAPRSVANDRAPIWIRDYSDGDPAPKACAELARVLSALSAKRLVMGHTVQKQGINSACNGQAWRIDVGLSRFYGAPPSALEIRGSELKVLQAAPSSH